MTARPFVGRAPSLEATWPTNGRAASESADNCGVDEDFDETVTVPRLALPRPVPSPLGDVEHTVPPVAVPAAEELPRAPASPPKLVEPPFRPLRDEPSGIELTAQPHREDVSTRPYTRGEYDEATFNPQMFYRFRIGRTVVWLDAVSYVGRRPSSPRIIYGQMPRLVRVPSPKQEVSSTHVELRQLGASVVLTDMRSTNGSIVLPPGGEPRKLRQGESVVATPGTLVDIGDGNVIEILPLQSRAPSDEASAGVSMEGQQ